MFKIRFNDIVFFSDRKHIKKSKIILFFYGLGCASTDFNFLLKQRIHDKQILIAELPGHNNLPFNNINLVTFSRKIYIFLKKNAIKEIIFFTHSIGGIIPILLVKNFIKNKIFVKRFINYEGNLVIEDTEMLTKKTISYNKDEFIKNKYKNLIVRCKSSENTYLNLWSRSLIKTSSVAFYEFSKECVELSKKNQLLRFFKIFFKNRVYINGEFTNNNFLDHLSGSIRYSIKNSGHFAFFENKLEFVRTFNQLILKK